MMCIRFWRCSLVWISVQRKAACHRSRSRRRLRMRKTGWFDECGLVPSPRPLPRGEGVNTINGNFGCHFAFIPGLFYAKKKRTTGSAKVHVGFSCSSFERNSLTVRGRQGSNTCRLVYVVYYSTECLIGIIVRCYAIYRHELSWRRRMNNEYS